MSFLGCGTRRGALSALGLVVGVASANACVEEHGGYDSCFAGGTRVATPQGDVAIEALRVGDAVLAYDLEREEVVVSRVTAVFVHDNRRTGALRFDLGEATRSEGKELGSLRATAEHPVFVPATRSWVPAGTVQSGTELLVRDGKRTSRAVSAGFDETDTRVETVYDITVDHQHNFFADGVLVHNKSVRAPDNSGGSSGSGGTGGSGGSPVVLEACYEQAPHELCAGAEVSQREGWLVLTLGPDESGLGGSWNAGGAAPGGAAGEGGTLSATVSSTLTTCAPSSNGPIFTPLSQGTLFYEVPAVPYSIEVWESDGACSRGALLASESDNGEGPDTVYSLSLPATPRAEPWNGGWTARVTSLTGAPLTVRLKVVEPEPTL